MPESVLETKWTSMKPGSPTDFILKHPFHSLVGNNYLRRFLIEDWLFRSLPFQFDFLLFIIILFYRGIKVFHKFTFNTVSEVGSS